LVASWATSQPGCALGSSSLGKSGIYQFLMVLKLAKMRFQTSGYTFWLFQHNYGKRSIYKWSIPKWCFFS
jgi:hypothetical protein